MTIERKDLEEAIKRYLKVIKALKEEEEEEAEEEEV